MLQPKLSLAALLIGASLLSACGDSTTNIVEKDPIPEGDHDHDSISAAGRLVISAKDSNILSVYDLKDGSLQDSFALANIPSDLAASPSYRYALAIQRTTDRIEFIDGGLYQEDHVDHLHDYQQAPELVSFVLNNSRPTHVTSNNSQLAVFFDGDEASGAPAAVAVLNDADITTDSNSFPVLKYSIDMHGAAQARGNYLISTVRDTNSGSVLPDKVAVFEQHGDHFHQELVFNELCPGLHGSAQNQHFISFGCTDGVLLIAQQGETFTASKLANTADLTATQRIGTLVGNMQAEHFVGFAGAQAFAIHAHDSEMALIDWQATEGASLNGYGFADKGSKFVLLDSKGYLTILNYHGHGHAHAGADEVAFKLVTKMQLTTADVSTMPAGSRFELAISASDDKVYVVNPIDQTLLSIDLDKAEVIATKQLNFKPHKLVWLGIAEPTDAHTH